MNRQGAALLDTREGRLAVRARLYRLLADRPELMRVGLDLGEWIERTSPPIRETRLPLVEALAVEDTTEVDRLCGAAVRRLRRRVDEGTIDLLGYLEPDRLAAVLVALPKNRRRAVLNKCYEAAYAESRIDEEQVCEIEVAIEGSEATQREVDECFRALGIDGERITRELRKYHAGLPHDLTEEEIETIESPDLEGALAELREEVPELFEE